MTALGPQEARILEFLKTAPAPWPGPRAMEREIGIDNSTITRALPRLADAKFIDRDKCLVTAAGERELAALALANAVRRGEIDPATLATVDSFEDTPINISRLQPSPHNPRKSFDPEGIKDLAASIKENGLIEPIVIRPLDGGIFFEIIAGERRYRAIKLLAETDESFADIARAWLRVIKVQDDNKARVLAIIENLQREDISPLDEAAAFDALSDAGWSNEQIAKEIGKTIRHVQLRRQLTAKLVPEVKQALATGKIDLAHARTLTSATEESQRSALKALAAAPDMTADNLRNVMLKFRSVKGRENVKPYYKGPFHIDENGAEFFADSAEALRAAGELVEVLKAELGAKWAWVKVQDWFHPEQWDECRSPLTGGAVIVHHRHDARVEIREGLVAAKPKGQTAGLTKAQQQDKDRAEAERIAFNEARHKFIDDLSDALALCNEPRLGLAIVCVFLCTDTINGVDHPGVYGEAIEIDPASGAPPALAKIRESADEETGREDNPGDQAVINALDALIDMKGIERLTGRLAANLLRWDRSGEMPRVIAWLAARLEIIVPEILRPKIEALIVESAAPEPKPMTKRWKAG